jgi:hypothetical protein
LPHRSAGWIVSGTADPAVRRNDQGRNFCAYGIGRIAAGAGADIAISVVNPAIAISVVNPAIATSAVNPAVEIEAAIVTVAVTAKETMDPTTAAVESEYAAVMKSAASPKAASPKDAAGKAGAVKAAAVKAAAVKGAAGAASRVSGSGE